MPGNFVLSPFPIRDIRVPYVLYVHTYVVTWLRVTMLCMLCNILRGKQVIIIIIMLAFTYLHTYYDTYICTYIMYLYMYIHSNLKPSIIIILHPPWNSSRAWFCPYPVARNNAWWSPPNHPIQKKKTSELDSELKSSFSPFQIKPTPPCWAQPWVVVSKPKTLRSNFVSPFPSRIP